MKKQTIKILLIHLVVILVILIILAGLDSVLCECSRISPVGTIAPR